MTTGSLESVHGCHAWNLYDTRIWMRFGTDKTVANKRVMTDRMTSQELSFELETGWPGVLPLVCLDFFSRWFECRLYRQPEAR